MNEAPPTAPGIADAIITAIDDGILVVNNQGVISVFNPAAAQITGWSAADAINLNFLSVFKLVDSKAESIPAEANPLAQALKTHQLVSSSDFSLVSKAGKTPNISLSAIPIAQGLLVVFNDITAKKREDEAKSDFISTASHEMRTPVTAIDGYLSLLANPATATVDERGQNFVAKAQAAVKHLGQLFQDLLDTTKAEDGHLNTHAVPINALNLANTAVVGLTPQAQAKGLALTLKSPPGIAPIFLVLADQDQLLEALQNLIENGIKYTPQGSVTVSVEGDQEKVRFKVTDTGIGIAPEDTQHLFQKFYRIDNSDTRTIGGTGLGLYLTKRLVDNMHGTVWVESQVGQGSTFTIELPRLSDAEAKLQQLTPAPGPVNPVGEVIAPEA